MAPARSALAGRRIVVVFQPHRFTRTRLLLDRFGPALGDADEVLLTDIYPAGEEAIPGVTVDALAAAVARARGEPPQVVHALEDVPGAVARLARPGDVVITLGAGSVGGVGDRILEALARAGRAPGEEGTPCR
jgi:UDP-N-acetylmuramate--alanine ligase